MSQYLLSKNQNNDSEVSVLSAGDVQGFFFFLSTQTPQGVTQRPSFCQVGGKAAYPSYWAMLSGEGYRKMFPAQDPQPQTCSFQALPFNALDGIYIKTCVMMFLVLAKLSSCVLGRTLVKEKTGFNFPVSFENHIC